MAQEEKVLKVKKGFYGSSKRPVIWLIVEGSKSFEHMALDEPASLLFDEIKSYADSGFTIKFEE